MSSRYILIHPKDTVAVALTALSKGEPFVYDSLSFVLRDDIPAGHKFALKNINNNENIIKYGFPIGHATKDLQAGTHIHVHNTATNLKDAVSYTYAPQFYPMPEARVENFLGYRRGTGEVGIRNEIWIIPTVGCVNEIGKIIAAEAGTRYKNKTFDGVRIFTHPYGCSQMGDDQNATQQILASLAIHPNAGGVLILGLGCENNNISVFKNILAAYDNERVRFLNVQDTDNEIDAALKILDALAAICEHDKRSSISASELKIGLKCGGSDGFSGITANPLLGAFSDLHIAAGGSTVLTEVPEIFGAETLLLNRCKTKAVFTDALGLINKFKDYYQRHGHEIYENPSPGNKAGGITTLEDKSLGCVQKGGRSEITNVLCYGERLHEKGLSLLEGPGNDIVAVTALAAAGVHLILFTTGRGTPLGSPVPVIKVSTNTPLAERKKNWIDFNAGVLTGGQVSIDELALELYNSVLLTASGGLRTKNETNGFFDMAIFKNGITL